MKIFSNFDTRLAKRLYASECNIYGEDLVLFVKRDVIYLIFRVYIPILLWVIFSSLMMWGFYQVDMSGLHTVGWILVGITGLFFLARALSKIVDYAMDFMVVTPLQITSYDQGFIFNRSVDTLDISKIKSINIDKKGLMCSIFNYGSIVFFSEGDLASTDQRMGSIRMNYIYHPREVKGKITKIINLGGARRPAPEMSGSKTQDQLESNRQRMAHYQQPQS